MRYNNSLIVECHFVPWWSVIFLHGGYFIFNLINDGVFILVISSVGIYLSKMSLIDDTSQLYILLSPIAT